MLISTQTHLHSCICTHIHSRTHCQFVHNPSKDPFCIKIQSCCSPHARPHPHTVCLRTGLSRTIASIRLIQDGFNRQAQPAWICAPTPTHCVLAYRPIRESPSIPAWPT